MTRRARSPENLQGKSPEHAHWSWRADLGGRARAHRSSPAPAPEQMRNMAVPLCPGLETSAHPPHVRIRVSACRRRRGAGRAAFPRFPHPPCSRRPRPRQPLAGFSHMPMRASPIDRAPPRVTRWPRAARIPIRRSTRCRVVPRHPTGYLPTPATFPHLRETALSRGAARSPTLRMVSDQMDGTPARSHTQQWRNAQVDPPLSSLSKKLLPNRVHTSPCPVTSDHRCLYIYIAPLSHRSPSIAFARTHGSHSISAA